MNVKVTLSSRTQNCHAAAEYCGDHIIVKAGGKISEDFAEHIRGGRAAKKYRNNPDYVDGRTIIKDCEFKSPSTAAQFVSGRSTNGYGAWKVEKKKSLGDYLKELGLR